MTKEALVIYLLPPPNYKSEVRKFKGGSSTRRLGAVNRDCLAAHAYKSATATLLSLESKSSKHPPCQEVSEALEHPSQSEFMALLRGMQKAENG